jgi:NAD(P)H-flavin reductase
MADRNDRRPVLLIYGSKTWEDLTFREELDELKNAINMEIVYVLEDPPRDGRARPVL